MVLVRVDWVIRVLIEGCKPNILVTRLLTMAVRPVMVLRRRLAVASWVVGVGFNVTLDGMGVK